MYGDVLDANPDELFCRRATDEERVEFEVMEGYDHVEGWESATGIRIEVCDVLCKAAFWAGVKVPGWERICQSGISRVGKGVEGNGDVPTSNG